MKPLLSSLSLLLLCSACQVPNENASLQTVIQAEQAWHEQEEAQNRTGWPDLSPLALEKEKQALQDWTAQLDQIELESLAESAQINYALLSLILSNRLFLLDYEAYLMPFNSEGGFITDILYALQGKRCETESEEQEYLEKLAALPNYLRQQQTLLQRGLETGKTVPRLIIEQCLPMVEAYVRGDAAATLFLAPLVREGGEARHLAQALLADQIQPAYRELHDFLRDTYLPQTRTEIGASALPDGQAYYEQRVKFFTTLDLSPEKVFETGQQEVQRIRYEMDSIIVSLGFPGNFADFLQFLRTDPQFYAQTPEALLHEAAWLSKKAEGFLPRYFGKLPRMPFTVEPVPASIAPNYTGGRYAEGSYEKHKPGAYWVNTYRLETRPLYVLPALTLHEAVPGHHTQIMLAEELPDLPAFRQRTYLSAFGEGWALYCEFLGKEAGMYETPYEHFGALTYEMWRACRLVVDVGMHYKGWSRQEAVDFLAANTALSLHEVNTEIDRYIGWPAQALSYKMGELTIRRLRQEARQALQDDFDLRTFHDLVLAYGSVPMETLEQMIRKNLKL